MRRYMFLVVTFIFPALAACGGSGVPPGIPDPLPTRLVGVTAGQTLVFFELEDLSAIHREVPITGLAAGETILGLDMHQQAIYLLGSTSRLYEVDGDTGQATPIGAPFTPALDGTSFGFSATVDRSTVALPPICGVVSNTGQFLILDLRTGEVTQSMQLERGGRAVRFQGLASDVSALAEFVAVDADLDAFVTVSSFSGVGDQSTPFGQDVEIAVSMDAGYVDGSNDFPNRVSPLTTAAASDHVLLALVSNPAGTGPELFVYTPTRGIAAPDDPFPAGRVSIGSVATSTPLVQIAFHD